MKEIMKRRPVGNPSGVEFKISGLMPYFFFLADLCCRGLLENSPRASNVVTGLGGADAKPLGAVTVQCYSSGDIPSHHLKLW